MKDLLPTTHAILSLVLCLVVIALGCDRGVEPFDPNEKPSPPDLDRIFPETGETRGGPSDSAARSPQPEAASRRGNTGGASGAGSASADTTIRGVIEIDPALRASQPTGGVLFVIARSQPAGPPLAVLRVASPSFPHDFEIGQANVMMPSLTFSGEIQLSAPPRLGRQRHDEAPRRSGRSHRSTPGPGSFGSHSVSRPQALTTNHFPAHFPSSQRGEVAVSQADAKQSGREVEADAPTKTCPSNCVGPSASDPPRTTRKYQPPPGLSPPPDTQSVRSPHESPQQRAYPLRSGRRRRREPAPSGSRCVWPAKQQHLNAGALAQ